MYRRIERVYSALVAYDMPARLLPVPEFMFYVPSCPLFRALFCPEGSGTLGFRSLERALVWGVWVPLISSGFRSLGA